VDYACLHCAAHRPDVLREAHVGAEKTRGEENAFPFRVVFQLVGDLPLTLLFIGGQQFYFCATPLIYETIDNPYTLKSIFPLSTFIIRFWVKSGPSSSSSWLIMKPSINFAIIL
jgi:hypothetical protein